MALHARDFCPRGANNLTTVLKTLTCGLFCPKRGRCTGYGLMVSLWYASCKWLGKHKQDMWFMQKVMARIIIT
jgi:hypothetical protein